jgi:S-DNA-T family DNA segregation ATPase FtsK/SpoIIIE
MPQLTAFTPKGPVELGPALSIFDPIYIGIDEFGHRFELPLMWRNLLGGGVMDSGKSSLLNVILSHASLSLDCRLVLFDAKRVELGQWRGCADVFVGADLMQAISVLERLQAMMDNRYDYLEACGRRKVKPQDAFLPYVVGLDEFAYYTATVGKKADRERFSELLRDLVARGRAVGLMVVAATQRPSSDIIPTSLRDLFAWRFAGRCTTDASSDIILGHGWAQKGWSANRISPTNPGSGLLIAESGIPQRIKVAYLDDNTCRAIAGYATQLRSLAKDQQIGAAINPVAAQLPQAS